VQSIHYYCKPELRKQDRRLHALVVPAIIVTAAWSRPDVGTFFPYGATEAHAVDTPGCMQHTGQGHLTDVC